MRRRLDLLAIVLALLATATAHATDYRMADGAVHFSTPDAWTRIMMVEGDPEMMAFQVPDPEPNNEDTLARITVTSTKVADLAAFQQYLAARMVDALAQPSFHKDEARSGATWIRYTAMESGLLQTYVERYYFENGRALQLRCIRPAAAKAGKNWSDAFDAGCDAIGKQLLK